jgi:hypothetical protein
MPTPAPQPTRQQLDDLDALLQRMLALPVEPGEEPQPPLPTVPPEALTAPDGNLILSDPLMPGQPMPPAVPPPDSLPLPLLNPVAPAERRPPVLPPPNRPRSARDALAASRPPTPPRLLQPILALNRQFDSLAFGLGSPGRWLRRPAGRTLLGLVGLALLAVTAVLVLIDRIGWTW